MPRCSNSVSGTGLPDWSAWLRELRRARWQTVCGSRDGENTALHMVNAFATASGLCLGQEGTRQGHEIAAIKALLDTLTLKGCIVTIDAIGCQTEIAQWIVDRGGDYLLAVKDNQGKLAGCPAGVLCRRRCRRIRHFAGEPLRDGRKRIMAGSRSAAPCGCANWPGWIVRSGSTGRSWPAWAWWSVGARSAARPRRSGRSTSARRASAMPRPCSRRAQSLGRREPLALGA